MPRLPRKTKVNVAKCHAGHAKWRGAPGNQSAPPDPAQCPKCHACHAKRTSTKCHACHAKGNAKRHAPPAKWRGAPGQQTKRATRASQCPKCAKRCRACHDQPSAPSAMPATRNEGGCHQVPHLPRKTKVDVAECHAYHAKRR